MRMVECLNIKSTKPILERVEGDKQNDLKHHGGENRAVCLYSMDLITELKKEGHPIFEGSTGENITIQGQDWNIKTRSYTRDWTG